MMCQACWDEAYLIAELNSVPQAEVYNGLINSRPVTYHATKCAKREEVPAQEVQTAAKIRPQTKRGPACN